MLYIINYIYNINKSIFLYFVMYIYMSSFKKNSLEPTPKVKESVSPASKYNKRDHKCVYCRHFYRRCRCNQRMYNNCNKMLKMIMMLIMFYIVCKLVCSKSNNNNSFRLVKRY